MERLDSTRMYGWPGARAAKDVCAACGTTNGPPTLVPVTGGTLYPGPLSGADTWTKATDGDATTAAQTAAASRPYIQLQLDLSYSDINAVKISAGDPTLPGSSAYLKVWLSSTADFSATGTVCVEGLSILEGSDATVACTASAAAFVTVERVTPTGAAAVSLVVQDMQISRAGARASVPGACCACKQNMPVCTRWLRTASSANANPHGLQP